jgi:N-acetylglucosaminyl-diphospho-decaprenol L-rhamnosyltransferase
VLPLPPEREDQLGEEAEARRRLGERPETEPLPPSAQTIGAVVVTFNDAHHIAPTLRGLLAASAQVVVADLGSKDRTRETIAERFPAVRVVELPLEAGFGAAFNEGARLLDQPLLLLQHGDARLRPGALEQLYESVSDSRRRVACCAPRLVAPHGVVELSAGFKPTRIWRWRAAWSQLVPRSKLLRPRRKPKRVAYFAPTVRTDVDWVSGAAMLVRRDAFTQVGGMDEDYFLLYVDVDFCLRLRSAGWTVTYEPRARAIHLDRVDENVRSQWAARRRFARRYGLVGRLLGRS